MELSTATHIQVLAEWVTGTFATYVYCGSVFSQGQRCVGRITRKASEFCPVADMNCGCGRIDSLSAMFKVSLPAVISIPRSASPEAGISS
jgi:hypothetical protein